MKNLVNLLLIFLFFFSFGELEVKSTNITGATQNGNVFTVAPSHLNSSGTTGFRQYSNFMLDQNHILNLQYQNNMNKFVNIVNNSVTINGVLNTVKNGNFYNGNVIFITKGGFTVGANGVLNLGSLNVYARNVANPNIDTLSQMTDEALTSELNSYKNACGGAITINGRILAKDEVNFYSNSFVQGANSTIATGFDDSKIQNGNTQIGIAQETTAQNALNKAVNISDIINTGKLKDLDNSYKFSANNGKIEIISANVNINGKIKSGSDINITQTGGKTFSINGNIETRNNLNIIKNSAYDLTILEQANLNAENILNISHTGTGRMIFKNGSVLNGYDININQAAGGNLDLYGKIDATNDINIIKESGYAIMVGGTGNISAGNELNISANQIGNVNIVAGSTLSAKDITLFQRAGRNMDIHGNITAQNNLTILDTANYDLNIGKTANLNAGNELNILQEGKGRIIFQADSVLNGNDVNINQVAGSNLDIKGKIDATNNVNITKGGSYSVIVYGTGNISAGNELNISQNQTGNLNIANGSTLSGKNITLYQKEGRNMDIHGNITAQNNLTILDSANYDLNIGKTANLNAGNELNIFEEGTGRIIFQNGGVIDGYDVNIKQKAGGDMDISTKIDAKNNINITKAGGKCIYIKNELNALNDITITSLENSNTVVTNSIKANNNINFIGNSTGNVDIKSKVTAGNEINAEKNVGGRLVVNKSAELEANDINFTQNTGDNMLIDGKFKANNDINLKHTNEKLGIRISSNGNLEAANKLKIDATNSLLINGQNKAKTIDINVADLYLNGGKLIANNDINITNTSLGKRTLINGTLSVLEEGNITLNTNTWLGFYSNDITNVNIKKGDLIINALKGKVGSYIRPAGNINLEDGDCIINSITQVTLDSKLLNANNLIINNSSDYKTHILKSNINLKKDLKINNTGKGGIDIRFTDISVGGSIELNANDNMILTNSSLSSVKDTTINAQNGKTYIYKSDINVNNGDLTINKTDNDPSRLTKMDSSLQIGFSNINVKNGDINVNNNSPKQLALNDSNVSANNLNLNNQNTQNPNSSLNNIIINNDNINIKENTNIVNNGNGTISIRDSVLKTGKDFNVVNNLEGKDITIKNSNIDANNDVTILNRGKGATVIGDVSNINSEHGNVSVINDDNADYIKLETGSITAMDWINILHKKYGDIYVSGVFEMLQDGSIKFTPSMKFLSKNGKYNIQDYLYNISEKDLIIVRPEDLIFLGLETKKLLDEKSMSEKIRLADLIKLINLSKQYKLEMDKLIRLSRDLDLNDVFKKYLEENNYEL